MRTSFKVKTSKVKVTKPIIALTENVSYYVPNGKAYELQNRYADSAWGSGKNDGDPRVSLGTHPRASSHLTAHAPYLWNG